jgi:hypothetical protein
MQIEKDNIKKKGLSQEQKNRMDMLKIDKQILKEEN